MHLNDGGKLQLEATKKHSLKNGQKKTGRMDQFLFQWSILFTQNFWTGRHDFFTREFFEFFEISDEFLGQFIGFVIIR
jgi:hypothetical protein